ncbi:putative NAD(P)-binding Rossmann-fold superfamily protein [Hibiscus syriacus]|uniref:NAD(P)-binding Rossmann-fold superfamily protein n=1 Tax=Hibiscus syriacus TaxID=106335 RepID=A0A6A2ZHD2_HIBSY|nr:putative NAD(P)-binding Rossmann-fold superfamily protein [Hibiscus syriacus]
MVQPLQNPCQGFQFIDSPSAVLTLSNVLWETPIRAVAHDSCPLTVYAATSISTAVGDVIELGTYGNNGFIAADVELIVSGDSVVLLIASENVIQSCADLLWFTEWASKGRLIIESDSKIAVDWIKDQAIAPAFLSNFVKEIASTVSTEQVIVRWIPRWCNSEADKLAKEGIGNAEQNVNANSDDISKAKKMKEDIFKSHMSLSSRAFSCQTLRREHLPPGSVDSVSTYAQLQASQNEPPSCPEGTTATSFSPPCEGN